MPGVSRKGQDAAAGTLKNPPKQYNNQLDFCFAEGYAICVKGQSVTGHGTGLHSQPTMIEASSRVFVQGVGVVRKDDAAICGHTATGSSIVFAD